MNKKKYILTLVIVLLFVVLLVAGGTYAYWSWNSTVNKDVVFNTSKSISEYVVYDEGDSHFIGNFQPKNSFCQSASNTLSFYKTSEAENIRLSATLNMDVNFVGSNIAASDSVYWVLTSGDNTITCSSGLNTAQVINYGTFNEVTNGQTITLKSDIDITTTEQKFTVWIWIDSAGGNLSSLSGETVDTNIWTQIDMLDASEPAIPELDEGMIPVTIANDGTVTTISSGDPDWYNYGNKQWANAVLINDSSRNNYKNTTGKTVNQSDILAYYVWIPRYAYKIPESVTCSEIVNPTPEYHPGCYKYIISESDKNSFIPWVQYVVINQYGVSDFTLNQATNLVNTSLETGMFSMDIGTLTVPEVMTMYNDSMNPDIIYETTFSPNNKTVISTSPRPIDILFERKNASLLTGDAINTYRTHPAFTFGTENISGIWVGKFETTGDGTTPTILPNSLSLDAPNASTQFQTSLKFAGGTLANGIVSFAGSNVYGLTANTDSHMMKNSEWGAVAYLSHSQYGINYKVRINNNDITGCGTSGEIGSSYSCEIVYGEASSYPQSTTGNISGVFDMSGDNDEQVMGILSDNNGKPRSGENSLLNSGFNGLLSDDSSYTSGINFPQSKYYDLFFSTNNSDFLCSDGKNCYGQALYETLFWYSSRAVGLGSSGPWFIRGGERGGENNYGKANIFSYGISYGGGVGYAWRSVLVTK